MGAAMLRGWLAGGLDPARLLVIEPHPTAEIEALAAKTGFALRPAPPQEGVAAPEVLTLAIKPQMLDDARALAPFCGPSTLLLSILAGKRLADLAARLPGAGAIVRAMPNLPAAVGRGMTGLVAGGELGAGAKSAVEALIGATGEFQWIADERLMDAVTAISGSGPAYVFLLVESLARAGEALGLPPESAARLARATVEGAGELLRQNRALSPAELRQSVTSPGGTTAAALVVVRAHDGLAPLLGRAA
ncbi:pyrroline-5-carboxylate reductase, partial [Methylocella sp.]|uniref:pyrroline-5-carboxylate reductase n=1 Tax=Methylocella sp. TaxID=1978226 RepID=UPI003784128A